MAKTWFRTRRTLVLGKGGLPPGTRLSWNSDVALYKTEKTSLSVHTPVWESTYDFSPVVLNRGRQDPVFRGAFSVLFVTCSGRVR